MEYNTVVMTRIKIIKGNITHLTVDAIVNAANTSLLGGGGVDGAIHRAAGRELEYECRLLGGCKTGQAKLTKGYHLPASYIIHTVGPVWNEGVLGEIELLTSCYQNCLAIAAEKGFKTLAFPAISTGIFKFPLDRAADIAVCTVHEFQQENALPETVSFVCYDVVTFDAYKKLLPDAPVLVL
jgi:O-acetyl-ADP-ribose deacetylase